MTPHKQLIRHDPENGAWGDCHRTCIACLLDLHPGEVPHPYGPDTRPETPSTDAKKVWQEWLAQRGLSYIEIPFTAPDVDAVLETFERINPGLTYMLAGSSRHADHVVIVSGGKVEHDPSPSNIGLVGPASDGFYWIMFLVPLLHFQREAA